MKIRIKDDDILPSGEYELTDINKLENAKNNFSFPPSERQILVEYDRIAGKILKDGEYVTPQSLSNLEKNRPIEKYSDEELRAVLREATNSNIPGSRYQQASAEYKLRNDQKILEATKRTKWASNKVPTGYPSKCSTDQIREVIQDLSEEKNDGLHSGKVNLIWEKIIDDHINNGERELTERRETRSWYERPAGLIFIAVASSVITALIFYIFPKILPILAKLFLIKS